MPLLKSLKKMNKQYKLDTCVWEITRKCNFNCVYCGTKAGKAHANELGLEKCMSIANQLVAIQCRRVVLIGGEVFFKQGWNQITKYLVDNNIDTSIITNGYLVDDSIVDALKHTGIRHISLSIDGVESVHDEFRCTGSYAKAINTAKQLKSNGFIVSVVSTLNSKSIKTVNELYSALSKVGIDAWQLQLCSPFGNARENRNLVPNRDSVLELCKFIQSASENSDMFISAADNIGYHTAFENSIRGGQGCFCGCSAGLATIGIDSLGNVRGCESLYDDEFIEGNLINQSLSDIWNNPNAFGYNRGFRQEYLTGKCKGCKNWHKCAGGCRSFNYFTNGRIYESTVCLQD